MELLVLDPFGDYETAGYLRNHYQEKDLNLIGHVETAAFEQEIVHVVRSLRKASSITYEHVTTTHQSLFQSVYPWAGQDRSTTAPTIAIVKAGYKTLFAHPADVQRPQNTLSIWDKIGTPCAAIRGKCLAILPMLILFLKAMAEPSSPSLPSCPGGRAFTSSGKR